MKTAYNLEPDTHWCLQDAEVQFSGPPYQCVGTLNVQNLSDQKLKIRYLPTTSDDKALCCEQLFCQLRVPANTQQKASARLNLPPNTPPGQYHVKIQVGDRAVNAQVEVLENDVLKMQPKRTVLEGCPGETITKTVNFHNQGNTEIVLPARSMVWFEERDWLGHNLVQTIRDTKTDDNYEDYLNALLKRFQKTMLPAITVEFDQNKDVLLPPASQLSRSFSVTLPEGLLKGKTYHGFVKVQRFRFWLAVYCNNGAVKKEKTYNKRG